jgi:hypothetical protein
MKSIRALLRRRMSRAAFCRSLGRYVLLGTLALIAAWMIFRKRRTGGPGGGTECVYDLPCRQCAELGGCGLARATRARQDIRRGR